MNENKKEESFIGKIIATIAFLGILFYIGVIAYFFITNIFLVGLVDALGGAFVLALPLLVLGGIALWISD
jgi:hypothetical protein